MGKFVITFGVVGLITIAYRLPKKSYGKPRIRLRPRPVDPLYI